jgi:uncharacterized peroxidase-related enzyme
VCHHRVGLARELARDGFTESTSKAQIEGLITYGDTEQAVPPGCTERERAILTYALKLTRKPAELVREDLSPMRDAGLDDAEILDVVHVVGYYAYANRIADGLGVELEAGHPCASDRPRRRPR